MSHSNAWPGTASLFIKPDKMLRDRYKNAIIVSFLCMIFGSLKSYFRHYLSIVYLCACLDMSTHVINQPFISVLWSAKK
jgi:hypothetical protein